MKGVFLAFLFFFVILNWAYGYDPQSNVKQNKKETNNPLSLAELASRRSHAASNIYEPVRTANVSQEHTDEPPAYEAIEGLGLQQFNSSLTNQNALSPNQPPPLPERRYRQSNFSVNTPNAFALDSLGVQIQRLGNQTAELTETFNRVTETSEIIRWYEQKILTMKVIIASMAFIIILFATLMVYMFIQYENQTK